MSIIGKCRRYDQEYKNMIVDLFKSGIILAKLSYVIKIKSHQLSWWFCIFSPSPLLLTSPKAVPSVWQMHFFYLLPVKWSKYSIVSCSYNLSSCNWLSIYSFIFPLRYPIKLNTLIITIAVSSLELHV